MDALFTSAVSVSIAELGDKTQLLALILTCRFRKPLAIIAGMVLATLLNHLIAGYLGIVIGQWLQPNITRWIIAASFFMVAIWALFPDKMNDESHSAMRYGPFLATLITFFIAEIGDKTQIATLLLAAKFHNIEYVVIGSTLGVCVANIPVMLLGYYHVDKLPLQWIRRGACLLFTGLGIYTLCS
ncbi:TMEM165/GDT1 family protein [Celerinatantimonas yamalensis]|uniref:GDT1 family protein n=1 Tax=Celerinatantimonas yamalensis TaxID=559956 RepID=A0ABW9G595_9GAMM